VSGVSTWWSVRIGLFTSSARLAQCRSYTQSVCTVRLGFLSLSHRHAASLPPPRPYIQLSRFACLLLLTVFTSSVTGTYKPMLKGINLTLSNAGNMRSRNLYQKLMQETCMKNLTQVHHSFLHHNNSMLYGSCHVLDSFCAGIELCSIACKKLVPEKIVPHMQVSGTSS